VPIGHLTGREILFPSPMIGRLACPCFWETRSFTARSSRAFIPAFHPEHAFLYSLFSLPPVKLARRSKVLSPCLGADPPRQANDFKGFSPPRLRSKKLFSPFCGFVSWSCYISIADPGFWGHISRVLPLALELFFFF